MTPASDTLESMAALFEVAEMNLLAYVHTLKAGHLVSSEDLQAYLTNQAKMISYAVQVLRAVAETFEAA